MVPLVVHYQNELDRLRTQQGLDFAALAFARSEEAGYVLTWQCASGNLNDRYKRIVLQSGKGIAGIVFKTGKPMLVPHVNQELGERELYQYPIILSERLQSLGAIPLFQTERVSGVLLAGYREAGRMTTALFNRLQQQLAGRLGEFEIKALPVP